MRNTFIRSKDYLQRIELDEIYFFTKEKYKVVGIMKNNKIELSTSLYNINQLISDNISFFRCHKSYIININKIEAISKFGNKTYNIKFRGIKDMAYITEKSLKILKEKSLIL